MNSMAQVYEEFASFRKSQPRPQGLLGFQYGGCSENTEKLTLLIVGHELKNGRLEVFCFPVA